MKEYSDLYFDSDFRDISIKVFGNHCYYFKTFDFISESDYKRLNKNYKKKYAVYQLGFLNIPTEVKFGKIKKFTRDGDVILKNRKRFSVKFIFNIVDTENEARLLCEVWE